MAENSLKDPTVAPYIEDKGAMRKRINKLHDALYRDSKQPYDTAEEKNKAMKRERELREQWTTNMPSVEEMRRNRAGAVHKHMQWEKHNKQAILEWKETQALLHPESDDPDLCNVERYRPERPFAYDTTAQIPGYHAMSPQAKANWPEEMSEPKAKTAVSHFQREVPEGT